MLLAIDPGGAQMAWALFNQGRLTHCGLWRTKEKTLDARALDYSLQARNLPASVGEVVVERMTTYPGDPGKANDLLDLQALGAFVAGGLGPARCVRAAEWKGQVPKEIMQRCIAKMLDPLETSRLISGTGLAPVSLQHNVYDAVGIGLFAVGRLK